MNNLVIIREQIMPYLEISKLMDLRQINTKFKVQVAIKLGSILNNDYKKFMIKYDYLTDEKVDFDSLSMKEAIVQTQRINLIQQIKNIKYKNFQSINQSNILKQPKIKNILKFLLVLMKNSLVKKMYDEKIILVEMKLLFEEENLIKLRLSSIFEHIESPVIIHLTTLLEEFIENNFNFLESDNYELNYVQSTAQTILENQVFMNRLFTEYHKHKKETQELKEMKDWFQSEVERRNRNTKRILVIIERDLDQVKQEKFKHKASMNKQSSSVEVPSQIGIECEDMDLETVQSKIEELKQRNKLLNSRRNQ